MNMKNLKRAINKLHPLLQNSLQTARQRMRAGKEEDEFGNFIESYYQLMEQDHFRSGETLFLEWRSPRRVTNCLSDNAL